MIASQPQKGENSQTILGQIHGFFLKKNNTYAVYMVGNFLY
ncbi:hypothetical protein RINTHM_4560 [Richelia intracellularis HM01]|nr:hypothetical protein RINTHM_4560 [Richelia intracellularis HM01]